MIVWDIETISDLKGFVAANSLHDTIIPGKPAETADKDGRNEWDDAA